MFNGNVLTSLHKVLRNEIFNLPKFLGLSAWVNTDTIHACFHIQHEHNQSCARDSQDTRAINYASQTILSFAVVWK